MITNDSDKEARKEGKGWEEEEVDDSEYACLEMRLKYKEKVNGGAMIDAVLLQTGNSRSQNGSG